MFHESGPQVLSYPRGQSWPLLPGIRHAQAEQAPWFDSLALNILQAHKVWLAGETEALENDLPSSWQRGLRSLAHRCHKERAVWNIAKQVVLTSFSNLSPLETVPGGASERRWLKIKDWIIPYLRNNLRHVQNAWQKIYGGKKGRFRNTASLLHVNKFCSEHAFVSPVYS